MRWIVIGYTCFIGGIIVLANAGRGTRLFALQYMVPGADKAGHFVLMGLLAFLVNLGLGMATWRVGRFDVLKGSLLVLAFVIVEELSQVFFANRNADPIDLLADLAGIIVFGYLAQWVVARRNHNARVEAHESSL